MGKEGAPISSGISSTGVRSVSLGGIRSTHSFSESNVFRINSGLKGASKVNLSDKQPSLKGITNTVPLWSSKTEAGKTGTYNKETLRNPINDKKVNPSDFKNTVEINAVYKDLSDKQPANQGLKNTAEIWKSSKPKAVNTDTPKPNVDVPKNKGIKKAEFKQNVKPDKKPIYFFNIDNSKIVKKNETPTGKLNHENKNQCVLNVPEDRKDKPEDKDYKENLANILEAYAVTYLKDQASQSEPQKGKIDEIPNPDDFDALEIRSDLKQAVKVLTIKKTLGVSEEDALQQVTESLYELFAKRQIPVKELLKIQDDLEKNGKKLEKEQDEKKAADKFRIVLDISARKIRENMVEETSTNIHSDNEKPEVKGDIFAAEISERETPSAKSQIVKGGPDGSLPAWKKLIAKQDYKTPEEASRAARDAIEQTPPGKQTKYLSSRKLTKDEVATILGKEKNIFKEESI